MNGIARFIPDRKILAAGLTGILSWLLVLGAAQLGVVLPADQAAGVVGTLMLIAGYFTTPSQKDILKRVDDTIIRLAGQ